MKVKTALAYMRQDPEQRGKNPKQNQVTVQQNQPPAA